MPKIKRQTVDILEENDRDSQEMLLMDRREEWKKPVIPYHPEVMVWKGQSLTRKQGSTLLYQACGEGDLWKVQEYYPQGGVGGFLAAWVHLENEDAFRRACTRGYLNIVKWLTLGRLPDKAILLNGPLRLTIIPFVKAKQSQKGPPDSTMTEFFIVLISICMMPSRCVGSATKGI